MGGSVPLADLKQPAKSSQWRPVVVALLVFAAAICLTIWIKEMKEGDEVVAKSEAAADENVPASAKDGDEPTDDPPPLRLAPPPEQQYDPFADPFGAPPLRGRTAPRPGVAGADAADSEIPAEPVPLESLLPPEPWKLERGSISGRLLNDKERPLAKGRVCAWSVDPRAPLELRRRPKCAEADRQGRFEIRDVAPGFYDINAFAHGFLPQSSLARDGYPLTVQPGEPTEGFEVVLVPGGVEVKGTVKTTAGDPIQSASVAAVGGVRALALTDATGAFSLWVGEGEVALVAWANGYTDVVVRGNESEPFAVVLRRESVLIGRVIDPETREPVENARVHAGAKSGIDPLVYTDDKGEFKIPNLAAGMYEPSARTDDAYGKASKPVKLVEETISAEVVLEARRFVVETPKPVAPAVVKEEVAVGDTGDTGDTDGTTGADDDTAGTGGTEEPPSEPSEVTPPVAPTTPAAAPGPTDRSLRKAFALKLKRCGKDGAITITAKYVLDSGKLFQPKVVVTGAAAKDPAIKACAEKLAKGLKLLRRNEPESFDEMKVEI
jgi:hypothetical protein